MGKKLELSDKQIESIWDNMEDVPFDEDENGELTLSKPYFIFPEGTRRETIWHWFDENYSAGIGNLI